MNRLELRAAKHTLKLMLGMAVFVGAIIGVVYVVSFLPWWLATGIAVVVSLGAIFFLLYNAVKSDMKRGLM